MIRDTQKEWELLQRLTDALIENIQCIGECDHSVGICCCGLKRLLLDAREVLGEIKWCDFCQLKAPFYDDWCDACKGLGYVENVKTSR